ncbi:MAG: hypothetical protein DMG24_02725 [Acidobacteria bacterium]|nr:MAG: hypothetical protein DMG24_02725 [Acidobacteriota bacterium]
MSAYVTAADRPCGERPVAGDGSGAKAILRFAECALEHRSPQQAVKSFDSLSAQDGDSHFRAGALLVEHKLYAAAARQFGIARRTYRDAYLAGYDQALAYLNAGDYPGAIRTANELLNQGHETAELADIAATAYLKNGQPQEAYNALRLATHLDPKNEDAYVDLCGIALDRDNYDLGLEIAAIGLAHLPNSERLYLQRGVMRAMKGEFAEAEQDFATSFKLAPQEFLPPVSLGLISMQMGHLEQAVNGLRQTVSQHPDNYLAQYWFAKVLLQSGAAPGTREGEEALAALRASVRLNPDFWHARADLGKALLDRGDVAPAIVELKKAAALNPSASSPLYLLAQAYRRQGDEARANNLAARVSKMQSEEREGLPEASLKRIIREGTSLPSNQSRP